MSHHLPTASFTPPQTTQTKVVGRMVKTTMTTTTLAGSDGDPPTAIEANAASDAERPAVVLRRSVRSRMTVGEASRRRKQWRAPRSPPGRLGNLRPAAGAPRERLARRRRPAGAPPEAISRFS